MEAYRPVFLPYRSVAIFLLSGDVFTFLIGCYLSNQDSVLIGLKVIIAVMF